MTTTQQLQFLNRLLGTWMTEATHPAVPGAVVHGTATMEWLEGERFLIFRSRTDRPEFPSAISIIGDTEHDRADGDGDATPIPGDRPLRMQYFDSRGVFRVYEVRGDDKTWRIWREAPGFSQQFTGAFADGGDTIVGQWQLRRDDVHWVDDLRITYRRQR